MSDILRGGKFNKINNKYYIEEPSQKSENVKKMTGKLINDPKNIFKSGSHMYEILNKYKKLFDQSWLIMMSMKLNLDTNNNNNEEIIKEFLDLMHIYKLDYTNTFLDLENNTLDKKIFKNWEEKYKNNKIRKFKNVNPQIIPRNHIIEEIINEVYSNNYSQLYEFEKLLKNPYEKIENKKYITPPLESEKVFETFCGT
mgnify:CR=1 FL=1